MKQGKPWRLTLLTTKKQPLNSMENQESLALHWDTAFLEQTGYIVTQHRAGYQARKYFPNGYGVSVIPEVDYLKTDYPALEGLYELAVLSHEGNGIGSHLCYDSGITDDVLRYLSLEEIMEVVSKVETLPRKVPEFSQ